MRERVNSRRRCGNVCDENDDENSLDLFKPNIEALYEQLPGKEMRKYEHP